jgi:hypothetical protein
MHVAVQPCILHVQLIQSLICYATNTKYTYLLTELSPS